MNDINNKKFLIDYIPTVKGGWCYKFFKRLFDIAASFIGLIILSPIMIILAIAVLISIKGNCSYVDKRVGRKGKQIGVLKFRTMHKGSNEHPERYLNQDQQKEYESERRVTDDPRVTKLGKFLRKSALDELPQLLNIFIGQMSFVGPRPVTEKEIKDNFTKEQAEILLSVRPGLTGNWRAYGKNSAFYANGGRQRLELEYLAQRTFGKDMKIIFDTFASVLTSGDAKR